jgi:ATP-binding cassette subfamily F protein 3
VFVSHDRYFVDALATRVVEVAAGAATAYLGNYEDFLRARGGEGHSALRVETTQTVKCAPAVTEDKAARVAAHAERKAAQREAQKRERQLAEVEARIADLEGQLAVLVKEMQDPALATDHARLYPLIDRHAALQADLDVQMAAWEELHEQVEDVG